MKFSLYGLTFDVLAVFPDTDEGTDAANAFCARTDINAGVLQTFDGEIIIASMTDKGVGKPGAQDNPHWIERTYSVRVVRNFVARDSEQAADMMQQWLRSNFSEIGVLVKPAELQDDPSVPSDYCVITLGANP